MGLISNDEPRVYGIGLVSEFRGSCGSDGVMINDSVPVLEALAPSLSEQVLRLPCKFFPGEALRLTPSAAATTSTVERCTVGESKHESEQDAQTVFLQMLTNSYVSNKVWDTLDSKDATVLSDEDGLVEKLWSLGYRSLSHSLQSCYGDFWDGVRQLPNAMVMDQVASIYRSGTRLASNEQAVEAKLRVANFALRVASEVLSERELTKALNEKKTERLVSLLGRLMFLQNRDLEATAALIDEENEAASLIRVLAEFESCMDLEREAIKDRLKLHSQTGLQPAKRAWVTDLPMLLSRQLLCADGSVNFGIVYDLRDQWVPESGVPHPHQVHMGYVLRELRRDPLLREAIRGIDDSPPSHGVGADLVRVALQMKKKDPVGVEQVRTAVLGSLLSYLRQGDAGTCFASFLSVLLLACDLKLCVQDFTSLVVEGHIARPVDKKPMNFGYGLWMGRQELGQRITVDPGGDPSWKVIHKVGVREPIWKAPGVAAACRMLGIEDVEAITRQVLEKLWEECKGPVESGVPANYLTLTVEDLLTGLVDIAIGHGLRQGSKEAALVQALFAYEGQTNSPLLRVWETVIANMAETTGGNGIVDRAVGLVDDTIKVAINAPKREQRRLQVMEKVRSGSSPNGKSFLDQLKKFNKDKLKPSSEVEGVSLEPDEEEVRQAILEVLRERLGMSYDGSIRIEGSTDDEHSSQGGFRLFDRGIRGIRHAKTIVRNEEEFNLFLLRVLDEAYSQLKKGEEIFQDVAEFVSSGEFVKQALTRLTLGIKEVQDTPWCFTGGTNFKRVLATYFSLDTVPELKKVHCPTAERLITQVIEVAREHQHWIACSPSPRKLIPAAAHGLHVYSIMLDHPTLRTIVGVENPLETIQSELIEPGRKISRAAVDESTKNQMIAFCLQYQDTVKHPPFHKAVIDCPSDGTVKEYRDALLEVLLDGLEIDDEVSKQDLVTSLDECLIASLPLPQRRAIRSAALHFGDTHWFNGLRDIHFCVYYNPGTERLELGEINDDNTRLVVLNQRYWLEQRDWEFLRAETGLATD